MAQQSNSLSTLNRKINKNAAAHLTRPHRNNQLKGTQMAESSLHPKSAEASEQKHSPGPWTAHPELGTTHAPDGSAIPLECEKLTVYDGSPLHSGTHTEGWANAC